MDELDIDINDSEQIKQLRRRIISLESQLEVQKSMNGNLKGGKLISTEAIDLYPGEQYDFILSILEQARSRCPEGSRPRDILDSILSVNKPVEVLKSLQSSIAFLKKAIRIWNQTQPH